MADTANGRCARCRYLYSLGSECAVITLTFLHVMATMVELLIHLEVIQVPNAIDATASPPVTTDTSNPGNGSGSTVSQFDPGGDGDDCDYKPTHQHLELTVQIFRYATLVVSALFFIEIFAKMIYARKKFFKDLWQVFDLAVVLCSLGVEIAFFLLHERFLCVHPVTEVAGYIVVLRLWRIPRTCSIRKKEYAARLDNELVYLTKTKTETDLKYQYLQSQFHKQKAEANKMLVFLSEHTDIDISHVTTNKSADVIRNGNGPPRHEATIANIRKDDVLNKLDRDKTPSIETISNGVITNIATSKNVSNTSPVISDRLNHKTSHMNGVAANSSQSDNARVSRHTDIEFVSDLVGDVKADADDVFVDSEGSETPAHARLQQVEVQIEDKTRQPQLPSISSELDIRGRQKQLSYISNTTDDEDDVELRRPRMEAAGYQNNAYVRDDGADDDEANYVYTDDCDGTRTYKSAEGIPITEL